MLETLPQRKNKISLADYDYKRDIENRLLMAQFSALDVLVLEEILFSSLSIPIKKLATNLKREDKKILPSLKKLSATGLLSLKDDTVLVDKEMRKYYEAQVLIFDPEFCPGMEFLQGLLRKVPIHVLPSWYAIPRTSNNIFDSIMERYLLTPQIFQRYLGDLQQASPQLHAVVEDIYYSPNLEMSAKELMHKYHWTHEQFEEQVLLLEFHLVACLRYKKVDDEWQEILTPFHEWHEYLSFMRTTETSPILDEARVERSHPQDFAFVQDMGTLLSLAKKSPLSLAAHPKTGLSLPTKSVLSTFASKCEGLKEDEPLFFSYVEQILSKLKLLKLAEVSDARLQATDAGLEWLDMRLENRAMHLYRHPLNRLLSLSAQVSTDRHVRDAEKSVQRILNAGWVRFEDFIKGVYVTLNHESPITLKKLGKNWKYALPQYSEEETKLIFATIFEWLFEVGVVATGTHDDKECFCVTAFGRSLFGR